VEVGGFPVHRPELPAPQVVLVVTLAGSLRVHGQGQPEAAPVAFVVGVGRSSVSTRHDGRLTALEVRLSPPEAGSVLGVPAGELADQVVALTDLWGPAANLLVEQLAETSYGKPGAGDWQQRFALVEKALLDRAGRATASTVPGPALLAAHRLLEERGGDLPMSALLEQTGWSRQRLAGEFRRQVGPAPKRLARLMRFRHAERLMRSGGHRSLASIALTCGYYDQAHLNRDFLQMAGCTPTMYLARLRADAPAASMMATATRGPADAQTSKTPASASP